VRQPEFQSDLGVSYGPSAHLPELLFLDTVDGMIGDAGQHFAQISFGIEAIEFRGTD
jgi:hypothetical protein